MPLMSTCVARLGSRHSIIFDPNRKEIHYGAGGLLTQPKGEMIVGVDDGRGAVRVLPFTKSAKPFEVCDQEQTMTSLAWHAQSLANGVALSMEIVAPFWPQDEKTSTVPAYLVTLKVKNIQRIRVMRMKDKLSRRGVVRFGLKARGATVAARAAGGLKISYPITAKGRRRTTDTRTKGAAGDLVVPLSRGWKARKGMLEAAFDVSREGDEQTFTLALVGWTGDALFTRFGVPMKLKYASTWKSADAVAAWVKKNEPALRRKSRAFDALFTASSLPSAAQDLSALAFQSYLMCTLWAKGASGADWFSVWEGWCRFNSTVDVTYNEAPFYFSMWPELLEKIFEEWSVHVNDAKAEHKRECAVARWAKQPEPAFEDFPGVVLEHDMGSGWVASGMSYHHAMPVEENANWLLLLYAHGVWWGREKLFAKYRKLNVALTEYLLWSDSTGNGFPDRGTANTIDDATPAVQYGRDNVYLGVKRLAALHAAGRMLEATGDRKLAARCRAAVKRAVKTLNAGWLGDHWGVCLDKSAVGLNDAWTREPLPYKVLPGWDAYSLYTTNGLLYLLMVDDLPPGLDAGKLRTDLASAIAKSRRRYGCVHSSGDTHIWISMNIWRDAIGAYLGEDLREECERYWASQVFANGPGADKANCFDETPVGNGLVWYPRGAAIFALLFAGAGLVMKGGKAKALCPVASGQWPLLPLADWKRGKVPVLSV